jgi:hypothetical protein
MVRIIPIKKINIAALLIAALEVARADSILPINPVGMYVLHSTKQKVTIQSEGEPQKTMYVTNGFSGVIKVIRIDENHVQVDLNGNKGFPSFNQADFSAALSYSSNTAVYTPLDYDKSCVITMKFVKNAVIVSQVSDDANTACGFGHAVAVDGLYKKLHQKEKNYGASQ